LNQFKHLESRKQKVESREGTMSMVVDGKRGQRIKREVSYSTKPMFLRF